MLKFSADYPGVMAKLLEQETGAPSLFLQGAAGDLSANPPAEVRGPDALSGPWARDRVYSRALTIAGGTTQVNKNIVAQRILGLPRS